jgi:hypothetical protein
LVVCDIASGLADGIARASASIDDGSAERALDTVRRVANSA